MNNFETVLDLCVSCGSRKINFWKSKSYFYTEGKIGFNCNIFVCKECGIGFLNPPPSQELLRTIYAVSGHALTSPVTLKEISNAERKFPNTMLDAKRMIKRAHSLNRSGSMDALDVGSGYGFCTKELRETGYRTISINPGKFENEVFRDLNGEYPLIGMLQDIKLDKKFGIVVLSQVLEHIPKPADIITRLSSLLEKGGVLVCAVPNFKSFSVRIRGLRDNGCLWVPEHVNYFTLGGLRCLFKNNMLLPIEHSFVTRIPYWALSKRLKLGGGLAAFSELLVKYAQVPFAAAMNRLGCGIYINLYGRKN